MQRVLVVGFILLTLAACDESPQAKEERRLKAIEAEIAENQKKVERFEAEHKLEVAKRQQFYDLIHSATDAQLSRIFYDCENRIRDDLRLENKGLFDAHFPRYESSDLKSLVTASALTHLKMGRPSTVLDREDFEKRRISWLREHPTREINVMVESTSDWFTAPKRWVAEYSCALDGLRVTSAHRGERYFLD